MGTMTTSRALALLALIGGGALFAWATLSGTAGHEPEAVVTQPSEDLQIAASEVPVLRTAPDLVGLDGWLQSETQALSELRGRVVVLQFWTFSCSNCKATIPTLQQIYGRFGRTEVEIVGVHAPEFGFEEDPDAVQKAANDLGVTWPIALDTSKRNFHSWQEGATAYWPRTYVIDPEGRIRFDHIGEGKYDELIDVVTALVAEL